MSSEVQFTLLRNQALLRQEETKCNSTHQLVESEAARKVLTGFLGELRDRNSVLLEVLPESLMERSEREIAKDLQKLLVKLLDTPLSQLADSSSLAKNMAKDRELAHQMIEKLYDYWREHSRFLIQTQGGSSDSAGDGRPYLQFNRSLDSLTDLVRSAYRDIVESITDSHPVIYRQVAAGFEVGVVATENRRNYPECMGEEYNEVPRIQQVTIVPPLVIDPPMNKRVGQFREVSSNPLDDFDINSEDWLCFPAKVGRSRIDVFFHRDFMDLGTSLANLFELEMDEVGSKPDAVYVYGADPEIMEKYEEPPTVFYDDQEEGVLYGAVPREPRFGYFGYLKKMMLTLHNIKVMKEGRMPVHGAMTRILLQEGGTANIAILGDSGAGKSETLEAFRAIGEDEIRDLDIICDDMGSLDITESGDVLGYGTETGAFVRLDDLEKGYAFNQLDRSIFMSPQRTNARALMPVAPLDTVVEGFEIDYLFYANNYEEIDDSHPVIGRFENPSSAMDVFRKGARMAKGTTGEKGLVHAYFANKFGPAQYQDLHEEIAERMFNKLFENDIYVGEMRTRLGIKGYETEGPNKAAKALISLIRDRNF